MIIIGLIIFALLEGIREDGILIIKNNWNWRDFKKLFWETKSLSKFFGNLDWFHFYMGAAYVTLSIIIALDNPLIWIGLDALIYLDGLFWVRNISMHVLTPIWKKNNPALKLWYLLPPPLGGWFNGKVN